MTELEIIARQGFKWMNGDQEIASTVDLLMVSVDIPHNGSKCCACNGCSWLPPHGCSWCDTRGKRNTKK